MRQFIKKILLFLLLFFLVDKLFYYFLDKAPKLEYDTRLEKVFNGKMNKDIIILGSSRGADNILAGDIEKQTGMTTYNLSYQGADVTFQYFVLKTFLQFNEKPKKVILSIDNPYEFDIENSLSFRVDRLQVLAKYNYMNNELIRRNEQSLFSKLFCLARSKRDQINFSQKIKTSIIPIDSYGSMPLYKKKNTSAIVFGKAKTSYSIVDENKEKLKAFKQIQELCNKNKIDLIYVFSPNYGEFNYAFYNRFKNEINVKKCMLYDLKNPIYKKSSSYFDESHLLEKTAKVFTKEIITFIQSN